MQQDQDERDYRRRPDGENVDGVGDTELPEQRRHQVAPEDHERHEAPGDAEGEQYERDYGARPDIAFTRRCTVRRIRRMSRHVTKPRARMSSASVRRKERPDLVFS